MKTHLRFYALSYAAEARIAKRLAKRAPHSALRDNFGGRIRSDLKVKARAVHLALGFIRGKSLHEIERPHRAYNEGHVTSKGLTKTSPDWELVEALVFAHGASYFESASQMMQRFAEFVDQGGFPTKESMSTRLTSGHDAVAQAVVEA